MLLVYTGEGKGKTSAAIGQAIRALGHDMRVAFCQFMKRPDQAGEQKTLAHLLQDNYLAGGKGFMLPGQDRALHEKAASQTVKWAWQRLEQGVQMLIMDEALYALGAGLLQRSDIEALADACNKQNIHMVLTGRGLPEWLEKRADLVTEMHSSKHPFEKGVAAQPGIEY